MFVLARIAGHSSITITRRYVLPQADAINRVFASSSEAGAGKGEKVPEHFARATTPEFIASELPQWLAKVGTRTLYIDTSGAVSPWENRYPKDSTGGKLLTSAPISTARNLLVSNMSCYFRAPVNLSRSACTPYRFPKTRDSPCARTAANSDTSGIRPLSSK